MQVGQPELFNGQVVYSNIVQLARDLFLMSKAPLEHST